MPDPQKVPCNGGVILPWGPSGLHLHDDNSLLDNESHVAILKAFAAALLQQGSQEDNVKRSHR